MAAGKFIFCLTLASLALVCQGINNKLLVIFIDGFRWDYFKRFQENELSGFNTFWEKGVKADYLQPVYPTRTHSNSYSFLTGLYPGFHGQVHNYMWDPLQKKEFLNGKNYPEANQPYWWDGGEPVWITAKKQGKKASVWYWYGCEVELDGYKLDYCASYQSKPNPSLQDFTQALWNAVDALKSDTDFAGVYWQSVDYTGHQEGPDGPAVTQSIRELDSLLNQLNDKLADDDMLRDKVNVVLFSDHGMNEIKDPKINLLDSVAQTDISRFMGASADSAVMLWPAEGKESTVYNALKQVSKLKVYKKNEIPDKYQLKRHYRVAPLLVEAQEGYVILKLGQTADTQKGMHGYDNNQSNMRGVFMARGPDFKEGYKKAAFLMVEPYNLMCYILGVKPAPNNGMMSKVCDMLVDHCGMAGVASHSQQVVTSLLFAALILSLCFVVN